MAKRKKKAGVRKSKVARGVAYECAISREVTEREVAARCVLLAGARVKPLALYKVPAGQQAWLSDFSWGCEGLEAGQVALGRLTRRGVFVPVVYLWEGETWSPARLVRFLGGESVAVEARPVDPGDTIEADLSLRLTEEPLPKRMTGTTKRI